MAALTAPKYYKAKGHPYKFNSKAAAGQVFKGAMLVWDPATGLVSAPTDVANAVPAGVYSGSPEEDRVFVANQDIELVRDTLFIPDAGAAQTDAGKYGYLANTGDWTPVASAKTRAVLCEDADPGVGRWLNFNKII
jgi:hypothetical protein